MVVIKIRRRGHPAMLHDDDDDDDKLQPFGLIGSGPTNRLLLAVSSSSVEWMGWLIMGTTPPPPPGLEDLNHSTECWRPQNDRMDNTSAKWGLARRTFLEWRVTLWTPRTVISPWELKSRHRPFPFPILWRHFNFYCPPIRLNRDMQANKIIILP